MQIETNFKEDKCEPVELMVGDIQSYSSCLSSCEEMDVVVHLAANTGVGPSVDDPRSDMLTNVVGTFNMLEAARQKDVKRFVFASSGAPAGIVTPPIHEEIAPHPVSPYGASKLAGEGYCSAYYQTFALETVALRFGNVYGPGSVHKSSVVAKFIKQALNGEKLEIYGDGSQTRDFIHIDDLIRAIVLSSVTYGIGGEIFQIATGRETTVGELADMLIEALSHRGCAAVKAIHTSPRKGDVERNYADISKAATMLKWVPELTIEKGIAQTIDAFMREDAK